MKNKVKVLNEYKAEQFLSKYLPIAKNQLVKKVEEIKIKAPLVLKLISDDAIHKTDIGGVKIVKVQSEVESAFAELLAIVKKRKLKIEGILAQQFHEGEQIIIGIKKDEIFNHVVVFGLGGVFAEVLQDISIRKCPITLADAEEMINELKASKIFHGFRGKTLNVSLLKKILVKTSEIPIKNKKIEEMDINPFILNDKDGFVVDARIVMAN